MALPCVPRTLLITCGALAREVIALIRMHGWSNLAVACLPATLHNTPHLIPDAVRRKIRRSRSHYERILVVYADCGTGGLLDAVLEEERVERIGGPHCYAFYRGIDRFLDEAEEEPGCFYLTDFLVRCFDKLVIEGLGLDRHPELLPLYFGNYTKVVYLAQVPNPDLERMALAGAARLGLDYEMRTTGYGELESFLHQAATGTSHGRRDHRLVA